MARGKKITKKKLKEPDEFISLSEKAYRYIVQYHKPIVTVGIILLVVVLVVILLRITLALVSCQHMKYLS